MFINRARCIAIAMCLFCGAQSVAHAQDKYSETRGELLYATHCIACHNEQVHWRERKRVTDWGSLIMEVRRWQANIGLFWSEQEITDTARYLNAAYYRFQSNVTQESSAGVY